MSKIKINEQLKDIDYIKPKVNGLWKDVDKVLVKVDGVWKETDVGTTARLLIYDNSAAQLKSFDADNPSTSDVLELSVNWGGSSRLGHNWDTGEIAYGTHPYVDSRFLVLSPKLEILKDIIHTQTSAGDKLFGYDRTRDYFYFRMATNYTIRGHDINDTHIRSYASPNNDHFSDNVYLYNTNKIVASTLSTVRNVYVVDCETGTWKNVGIGTRNATFDLVVDNDGSSVWVFYRDYYNSDNFTLARIGSDGNLISKYVIPVTNTGDMALSPDGFIYLSTSSKILYKFDKSGNKIWEVAHGSVGHYVSASKDTIYLVSPSTNDNNIIMFNASDGSVKRPLFHSSSLGITQLQDTDRGFGVYSTN